MRARALPAARRARAVLHTVAAPSTLLLCAWGTGCSDVEVRHLEPTSVALTDAVGPVYDDGELTLYEAKSELALPVLAPRPEQLAALGGAEPPDPFERAPWVTSDDVRVQITWTLSNLDAEGHEVWVTIDPWNEFGRYVPAIHVVDQQAIRDLSGIDMLYWLPGTQDGASGAERPRLHGTFTFEDMDELARDFATVFKILRDAPPGAEAADDPRATLVNHAFNVRNRSYNSPLLDAYRPAVVPALVGFDFGVRTFEPANVALEVVVEVEDRHGERVAERDERAPLLEPPGQIISVP